jgi:hypothetical protein
MPEESKFVDKTTCTQRLSAPHMPEIPPPTTKQVETQVVTKTNIRSTTTITMMHKQGTSLRLMMEAIELMQIRLTPSTEPHQQMELLEIN